MKKYMIMCMAVVALLFASCKNEDISISREVSLEVTPHEVINKWIPYVLSESSLAELSSNNLLRINLLVYGQNGDLIASDVRMLKDYTENMVTTLELADGEYTVVAISDVVENGRDLCWTVKGTERLSTLMIEKISTVITNEEAIVGIGNAKITVDANHSSHHVEMLPAGALVIVKDDKMTYWEGVVSLSYLYSTKNNDSYTFNDNATYVPNADENSTFQYRIHYNFPEWMQPNTIYWEYHFIQPFGNTTFQWRLLVNNDEGGTDEMVHETTYQANIKEMHVYEFYFDWPNLEWTLKDLTANAMTTIGSDCGMYAGTKTANLHHSEESCIGEPFGNCPVISKEALETIQK